jgi:phage shock protein C
MKRIYRDVEHKMIAGICAGVGEMLNIDPTLIRLALVFCAVATMLAPCIVAYLVGWFIIPEKTDISEDPEKK